MFGTNRKTILTVTVALAATLAAAISLALADFDERHSLSAEALVVSNLIGEITVEGHAGSAFEVEVRGRGRDVSKERLAIDVRKGSRAELIVQFPLDEETDYVYPRLNRGTNVSFRRGSDSEGGLASFLTGLFRGDSNRVRVRRSGRGLEMWADVTVKVPSGGRLEIDHGVGEILADGVTGDLLLDLHAANVQARSVKGDLLVDTGSGGVDVEDLTGDVNVDSGSGSVRARQVVGDVIVDTGSGSVQVVDIEGDSLTVDTGSGSVALDSVRSTTFVVDTGSGSVVGQELGADDASIDTGSGSVKLEFRRIGGGSFEVDTGSGGIELRLPPEASARIRAETGSGSISVDYAGANKLRLERHKAEVVLGAGAARIELDAGSGSIRILEGPG